MEEELLASEPLRSSSWGVYKDAFEPQLPERVPKAWERAPVTAHVPRLQGKKIWKRAVARGGKLQEKDHSGQVELETEGNGARKRMRLAGDKENIASAQWLTKESHLEDEEKPESKYPSPSKNETRALGSAGTGALLVPRKRTNANLLVTPRKSTLKVPSDKVILQETSRQLPEASEAEDPSSVSRKLQALGFPADAGLRRRKSLRRSTRRGTLGNGTESLAAHSKADSIPTPLNDRVSNTMNPLQNTSSSEPEDKTAKEVAGDNTCVTGPSEMIFNDVGEHEMHSQVPKSISAESVPALVSQTTANVSPDNHVASIMDQQKHVAHELVQELTPETSLESSVTVEDHRTFADVHEAHAKHVRADIITDCTRQPDIQRLEGAERSTGALKPELQSPILEATTIQLSPSFERVITPKRQAGSTPRSKKKTPQRSVSRRSVRVAGTSSIQAGAQLPQTEFTLTITSPQKLSRAQSPAQADASVELSAQAVTSYMENPSPIQLAGNDAQNPSNVTPDDKPTTNGWQLDSKVHLERPRTPPNLQEELDQQLFGNQLASSERTNQTPTLERSYDERNTGNISLQEAWSNAISELDSCPDQATLSDFSSSESPRTPKADTRSPIECSPREQGPINITSELGTSSVSVVSPSESLEPPTTLDLYQAPVSDNIDQLSEDQENLISDPTTTDLVEAISKHASPAKDDDSDADMLRNFLTRVKANKAAKAKSALPQRKRSLPHSPIQVPLETGDNVSPASLIVNDEFDVSAPVSSPAKRQKANHRQNEEEMAESQSVRRSGRTRLPLKAAPLAAPSFIPVRRLGQDGDNTITLRRNEEKELAALTRVNTRKNKGAAVHPQEALKRKGEEKVDLAARQGALKELFDEKAKKQASRRKSVAWAEELIHFQSSEGQKVGIEEPEIVKGREKGTGTEGKNGALKVGVRGKSSLGMASNGTPAPKRKMRGLK